jgi:hypothetical protein
MANLVQTSPLLDEILDFLASTPTLEQIIALRPSPEVQQHISTLLEKNREGALSAAENFELDEYLRLDQFVTLLKARARLKLKHQRQ